MGFSEKMSEELGITPIQAAGGAALVMVVVGGIIGLGVASGRWANFLFGPPQPKTVPSVIVTPSLVDGLMPGETVVVASFPNMGKEVEIRALGGQQVGMIRD
jgi:hypothetical protein